MKFVVDRNIPFAESALATIAGARVVSVPARDITPELVKDADIVWTRSTVKVGAPLLAGSTVKMVGTATIGVDHMDLAWLDAHGIAWASAPGSNAASVQLWWAAALSTIAVERTRHLARLTVGIVGVGHVGSLVESLARGMGCRVLRCDPPRARAEGTGDFVRLDQLCRESDIVTFHVPLTTREQSPDWTVDLLDGHHCSLLKERAIVVNASRGQVVDYAALLAVQAEKSLTIALDVFHPEPEVPPALVDAAIIATPHIAGHSLDGKANGTQMIYEATCRHLGERPTWQAARALPEPPVRAMTLTAMRMSDEEALRKVLRRFYTIEDDDAAMRKIVKLPDNERARAFADYRGAYPVHRELHDLELQMIPARPLAVGALRALGVKVVERG